MVPRSHALALAHVTPVEGLLTRVETQEVPAQPALVTLLALRHFVHTAILRGEPFTTTRTFWMFGFQRRRVRR